LVVTVGPAEDERRSCRLPFIVSDVLCVEAKNFGDYLFVGEDQRPPLLPKLLSFLASASNYVLAAYFAKIAVSLIKRHHNVQGKHNETLCRWLFATETLDGFTRHMYSRSIVDPILRLLTLKGRESDFA
jgi:hypothetical protein